ncbi:hypothetical protein OVY01_01760 [Robbsia sp. Bb-Pol-6]|uniref:Haemolysin activator HlyB C-terminal domain-containing protein n=1 Tax=Robbsia betulipollinis TaxID=2981849 RepID=A0ABT3ZHJ2_9BURK|nr:ShlB/FhaC/HecB family hemolysin secretion/activation protein [Robbsia betulipollinis]MCY0385989.1 hypothetical protein [Robbsia betulipollinis]
MTPPFRRAAIIRHIAGRIATMGLLLGCAAARAQDAALLAPDTLASPAYDDDTTIEMVEPPRAATTAPRLDGASDATRIRIDAVDLDEGPQASDARTAATLRAAVAHFRATLLAAPLPQSAILDAAETLEAAYARAGFVLVRVVVPEQALDAGARLRVIVVDAYLMAVDTSAVPQAVRAHVAAVLAPLVGRRGVRYAEIERQLLLAGDASGVTLQSQLVAGALSESSMLVVAAQYRPVTAAISADTHASTAIGGWSAGLELDLHSLAHRGETVYFRARGYPGPHRHGILGAEPRNRLLAGGIVMPLGNHGLSAGFEAIAVRAAPQTNAPYGFLSEYDRYSMRLRYALRRSQESNIGLEAAFDLQRDHTDLRYAGRRIVWSRDRLRVLRLGSTASWRVSAHGQLHGGVTTSFGLNTLGARARPPAGADDVPLSRMGADAGFRKLVLSAGYSQWLGPHLGVEVQARAQTGFNQPMAASEGMSLGGPGALSPFEPSALFGDTGALVRGEVFSRWQLPTRFGTTSASPYAFAALGSVALAQPTAVQRGSVTARAMGAGVRFAAAPRHAARSLSLALEYGVGHRNDGQPGENRFDVSARLHF